MVFGRNVMHIGIAGTGKMGSAMARRLLSCKHCVTVWNRTRDKAEPLLALGAQWAATPAELAGIADLVISMVTDERALDDVYCCVDRNDIGHARWHRHSCLWCHRHCCLCALKRHE